MGDPAGLLGDRRAVVRGALAGVAAYLVGFLATFALQYDDARESASFLDGVAAALGPDVGRLVRAAAEFLEPDPVQVAGWFFYGAHYVRLRFEAAALGNTVRRTVDVQALPAWDGALVLVPPAVLFATGFLLAARRDEDAKQSDGDATRRDGSRHDGEAPRRNGGVPDSASTGVSVTLGYAAAAFVGVRWVAYSRDVGVASATLAPDPVTAALHFGGYALAFATAGAAVHAGYVK